MTGVTVALVSSRSQEYAFDMGTKSPSDLSQSSMGDVSATAVGRRQLRSRGPVTEEKSCPLCKHQIGSCVCVATPSVSTSVSSSRGSKPRKKKLQIERTETAPTTRRQLFKETTTDYLESKSDETRTRLTSQPGPSGLGDTSKLSTRTRHTCPNCPKSFGSPGKLNQHMYSHTGERPFVCEQCRKAFSSKFKLVRHALIHSDQRQYVCPICERTFHRKDHLKNHAKIHSPVKRRYRCDREGCGKEYSSVLSYRKHAAIHSAEDGNLECTICGKKFQNKEEIVLHLKIHAGSRTVKTPADRKYRCDHCDRSFFTGKDVRRHLVVHTGKRDFLCQFCPQRFGRKDHLVRHIKKSHNSTGKKGRKKIELKTKSIKSILEETGRLKESDEEECDDNNVEIKSESKSSFGLFEEEQNKDPSTSVEELSIYKSGETKAIDITFSQNEPILSHTSEHVLPDIVFQNPPPPYPSVLPSSIDFEAGTSVEVKPEVMSEFIDLIPSQLPVLPPSCLLSMSERSEEEELPPLLPSSHFITTDETHNIHRQILNLIGPSSNPDTPTDTDIIMANFLSSNEPPSNTTPLPRFNQAFHQQP